MSDDEKLDREAMIAEIIQSVEDWDLETLLEAAKDNYRRELRRLDDQNLRRYYRTERED